MNRVDPATDLRAKLFNLRETRPASHIYVLLNNDCPVSDEHPLHPDHLNKREVPRDQGVFPSHQAIGTVKREYQPFLLQIHKAGENAYVDEDLLDLTLATALGQCTSINGAYVSAWIASEVETSALASRLATGCNVFDKYQGRTRRIPLFEPYRMALLAEEASEQAFLAKFLSAIHLWSFVDASGSLRTITPAAGPDILKNSGASPGLSMCRMQSRVPLARLALLGMVKAELPIEPKVEQRIDSLLVKAEEIGLMHEEDRVFFVMNGIRFSSRWFEHPHAQQCIERVLKEEASLSGLICQLPDELLEEIGQYRAQA